MWSSCLSEVLPPFYTHTNKYIFKKQVEILLQLINAQFALWQIGRILVQVGQQNGLRKVWFNMFSTAFFTMPASTDFKVKWAIDSEKVECGEEVRRRIYLDYLRIYLSFSVP